MRECVRLELERIDSMSENESNMLWSSGGPPGWRERMDEVKAREGIPDDNGPFVGVARFGLARVRMDYEWNEGESEEY